MADKQHNLNAITGTVTIPLSNSVITGTSVQLVNGLGRWVDFTTDDMEDTDTTNFVIVDEFGGTAFVSGAKAQSTTFGIGSVFPMYGTVTIVTVAQGTQSGARTIPYSITYDE